LLLAAGLARAEDWACYDGSGGGKPLVILTADLQLKQGVVKVAGAEHKAKYKVEGLNRRWDFGGKFSFVIQPDGTGYYYDYSEFKHGTPSQRFKCEQQS
jgi:hypothetical protein